MNPFLPQHLHISFSAITLFLMLATNIYTISSLNNQRELMQVDTLAAYTRMENQLSLVQHKLSNLDNKVYTAYRCCIESKLAQEAGGLKPIITTGSAATVTNTER